MRPACPGKDSKAKDEVEDIKTE